MSDNQAMLLMIIVAIAISIIVLAGRGRNGKVINKGVINGNVNNTVNNKTTTNIYIETGTPTSDTQLPWTAKMANKILDFPEKLVDEVNKFLGNGDDFGTMIATILIYVIIIIGFLFISVPIFYFVIIMIVGALVYCAFVAVSKKQRINKHILIQQVLLLVQVLMFRKLNKDYALSFFRNTRIPFMDTKGTIVNEFNFWIRNFKTIGSSHFVSLIVIIFGIYFSFICFSSLVSSLKLTSQKKIANLRSTLIAIFWVAINFVISHCLDQIISCFFTFLIN